MSRVKHCVEEKIKAVEWYLCGEASAKGIVAEFGMGEKGGAQIQEWVAIYREGETEGVHLTGGNNTFTTGLS